MIKLGEKQKMTVVKSVDFGVYVAPDAEQKEERVLLPKKQVPQGTGIGDELEVFIYRDSNDRLIATTNEVRLTLGEVALFLSFSGIRLNSLLPVMNAWKPFTLIKATGCALP